MPEVKAFTEEFAEQTIQLLSGFNAQRVFGDDWSVIWKNNWRYADEPAGYILLENNKVVGFLGLIYGSRISGTKLIRTCNMSSWIVFPEFRSESLKLFLPLLKFSNIVITSLTPSKLVRQLLPKLGFKHSDLDEFILLPAPFNVFSKLKFTTDIEKHLNLLSEKDTSIYIDHKNVNCKFVLAFSKNEYCLIAFSKRRKKHIPFNHIHYISNQQMFFNNSIVIRMYIQRKSFGCFTFLDSRLLSGKKPPITYTLKNIFPKYFMGNDFEVSEIDNMYSEFVLLDI